MQLIPCQEIWSEYPCLVKSSNPFWQYKQYVDWVSTKWNAHPLPMSPLANFLSTAISLTNGSNKSSRMKFSIHFIDCWLKKLGTIADKGKVICNQMLLLRVWSLHPKTTFVRVRRCVWVDACAITLHSCHTCPGMNGVDTYMLLLKSNTSTYNLHLRIYITSFRVVKIYWRKFYPKYISLGNWRLGMGVYGGCICTQYQDTVILYKHKVLET